MQSLDMATFERVSDRLAKTLTGLIEESCAIAGRMQVLNKEIESRTDKLINSTSWIRHDYNFLRCKVLIRRKMRLLEEDKQLMADAMAVLMAQGSLIAGEIQPVLEVLDHALARLIFQRIAKGKVWDFSILIFFSREELDLMELIETLREAREPVKAVS